MIKAAQQKDGVVTGVHIQFVVSKLNVPIDPLQCLMVEAFNNRFANMEAGTALIASVDGANASESPVLSENQMDQVTAVYTYYSGNGATFNGSVSTFTPISKCRSGNILSRWNHL